MLKLVEKLTYLVAKFGGRITAQLPAVQVVVRFKTTQNPIWSKALTMPLTIWDYVSLTSSRVIFKGKLASTSLKLL